jgi:Spy/CpxP family protein refolding chaperone
MKHFRLLQQIAVTAGLLALCGLPAAVRAQDAPQGTTQAQDQAAPGRHGHGQDDELAKLNLSDDQKVQVKKIHEDMKTKIDAVKGDSTLSADQQRARVQEVRKASHEQVAQILTPEQRKQMKSDEMARKAARQQGEQTPPPQQ